jgi:ATP-dependent protease ClpP protease subunit
MKTIAPFYSFAVRAAADGDEPTSAELLIFDTIGNWEEIGEISAKAFAKSLAELPSSVRRLDIHINSPGGSVYDAQGIYSRLADHRAEKIVYVDGLAASAASIVAMVGHKIYIRSNANMMIHLPMAITMGNEDDHDKSMRALRSITGAMLNTYAKKTGLGRGEIRDMLAAETWFTAEEAVEKGFADEVRGVIKATAVSSTRAIFNGREFDLSRFRNIPAFDAQQPERTTNMPAKPKENDEGGEDEQIPTTTPPPEQPTPPPEPAPPPPPADPAAATTDYARGITAERDRVLALQKLDRPATHTIIAAAIKDGKQPSDVFAECMDAMDKASKQTARHADARTLDGIPPSDGADGDENAFGALLTKKVNSRLKARGQRVLNSQN